MFDSEAEGDWRGKLWLGVAALGFAGYVYFTPLEGLMDTSSSLSKGVMALHDRGGKALVCGVSGALGVVLTGLGVRGYLRQRE